jgi:arabinogalactan oligomer/maltooligosaccharide transport system substrate-binding protein
MSKVRSALWRHWFLPVMMVLSLALVACGGTAATGTPVPEAAAPTVEVVESEPTPEAEVVATETTTETTETTPSDTATGLTLWVIGEQRVPALNTLGEQFAEEYGVSVTVEVVDIAEIRNQLLLGAGTGEGPDMAIIPHDNIGALAANGVLAEIDLVDKADSFLPTAINAFTYDSQLLGVPVAVENIGFFRNTELVPEAPATWDEVQAIGQELVENGTAEQAIALPDLGFNIYPLYTSYGGYIFGRDEAGNYNPQDIGLASEGMIEGLTWVTNNVEAELVSPNIDWEAAHVLFESGQTPFIMTGPWAITRFQESGVPYEITAFPAATEGGEAGVPFLGVQGLVINANSPDVLLAQTFATELLATEEAQASLFAQEPTPSAWTSVFEAATDPDIIGFSEAGVQAQPMPAIPEMGSIWDPWANAGTLAVQGELSPAEALELAVEQVKAGIAQ